MANWMKGAVKKPGALHRELGVPEGQDIPKGELQQAATKGGTLGKRARLAQTFAKFRPGKSSSKR